MMGPFHLSVGSSTGYQSSTTNALTLGGDSGSNLTRMRPLLGQSAPSLSASLVSSKNIGVFKFECPICRRRSTGPNQL